MSELVTRARKAAAWSFTDVLLRQVVQLASSMVLARLLVPEDFGVLALVSLVVFLAGTLAEGGLAQALIQKRDVRHQDVSSVFWFSLVVSASLALGLTAGSDLIAAAAGNPGTAPLIAFMSLALVLKGAPKVPTAMLTKALKFRVLSVASVGAAAVSGVAAILLALAGYGAWSLAWQAVIAAAVSCAVLMASYTLPRPLVFEWAGLKDLLRFGSWLVLGGFLNALKGGFATLLLARLFSLRDLGLYSRAEGTMSIPSGLLSSSSERVILPVLAQAGDDRDRLRRGARRVLRFMMLFSVPVMMVMAVTSDMLIGFLFGAQWLPAAPYLTAVCVGAVFLPMQIVNVQMLLALRRSDRFFYLDLSKSVVAITVLWAVSRWGVLAMAWSQVGIAFLAWLINTGGSRRLTNYGYVDQLADVLPTVVAGGVASGAALAVKSMAGISGFAGLVVVGASWGTVFLALAFLFRLDALTEARGMLVRSSWTVEES